MGGEGKGNAGKEREGKDQTPLKELTPFPQTRSRISENGKKGKG